jgi:N-methylhydantoinase B
VRRHRPCIIDVGDTTIYVPDGATCHARRVLQLRLTDLTEERHEHMAPTSRHEYDVIDIEVHRQVVRNIANEMAITLMRTSGSPVVTDAKDFSTCILDAKVEQIAFSGFVTFHISTAVLGVEAVLRNTPIERCARATPSCATTRTPRGHPPGRRRHRHAVLLRGRARGWGYVNEHVLDIGGSAVSGFALGAFDSFSETLAFPGRASPATADRSLVADSSSRRTCACRHRPQRHPQHDRGQQRGAAAPRGRCSGHRRRALRGAQRASKELSERRRAQADRVAADGTYESVGLGRSSTRAASRSCTRSHTRLIVEGDEMTIQFRGGAADRLVHQRREPAMIGQAWTTMLAQLIYDIPVNAGIWRRSTSTSARAGRSSTRSPPRRSRCRTSRPGCASTRC